MTAHAGRAPVLAVRLDSAGDMLLAGPAIRALAGRGQGVMVLAGPHGAEAARMLPGVDEVLVWTCSWIVADAPPVDEAAVIDLVARLASRTFSGAVIFTSFHQSALPTALMLRMAGIGPICAISEDYPGSLLDTRVAPPGDVPEAERALTVARAAGYELPPGDDGRLGVRPDLLGDHVTHGGPPYVVLHPGASAPSRRWPERRWQQLATSLVRRRIRTIVTGGPQETKLCAAVARRGVIDLSGDTSLLQLARVLRGASVVVTGNTGPAHLAAAVGTPVVSLFSPVVPAARWAPYGVPVELLGDQRAPCRDTRATQCPVPGHPCLTSVSPQDVVDALERLVRQQIVTTVEPQNTGGVP